MKRRGFTLVELLAVLVLISAIVLIVVPSIINYVNESKDDISSATAQMLYSGAQLYVDANPNIYSKVAGKQVCVPLKELVAANYLTEPILDSVTGQEIDLEKSITISYVYDEDLKYVKSIYGISDNCNLCTLVSGNANTLGAKYSCDFGAGLRSFYVLEPGSETKPASLILDSNYDTTTQQYCNQEGDHPLNGLLCQADGLTAKLDEIAGAWSKLDRNQITLPSAEQIMVADGKTANTYLEPMGLSNDWLYNGASYWTSTPLEDSGVTAWTVCYVGSMIDDVFVNSVFGLLDYDVGLKFGVRPVIKIDIQELLK